jgi:phospholipase C
VPDDAPQKDSLRFSRRRLLTGATALGGLTAASFALPSNMSKAMAATAASSPRSFSPKEVKHIVHIMMENRSFDQYFGTFPGVRDFNDPTALTLSTGKSVFYQPDSTNPLGYLLPWHLDTRTTGVEAIPDTSHAWLVQHSAWNGGKMDNWMPAHYAADGTKAPFVMGYHERQDLPFHWWLAENFTILDNYHCSVFGPTSPNRCMHMTGTLDPNGVAGGPILNTEGFTGSWSTYAEALTDAGVSWKVYSTGGGGIELGNFVNFKNAQPGSVLYDSGMAPAPVGKFEYDCLTGNLPTVSWIDPGSHSEHPSDPPADGANWIAGKLDAIMANRDLWESTVVILNYDENDGFFDHVPPPTPPAGTPDEFVTATDPVSKVPGNGLPIGLGFRVPCIIISPWTQGGWVCSDVSDHTSALKFCEVVTGVPAANISAWRRKTVSDLTGAFSGPGYNPEPPVIPDTAGELALASYTSKLPLPPFPGANQSFPVQHPGHRRHTR